MVCQTDGEETQAGGQSRCVITAILMASFIPASVRTALTAAKWFARAVDTNQWPMKHGQVIWRLNMKFYDDGTNEPCCDWAASYLMNCDELVTEIPEVEVETVQHDGDYYPSKLKYCSNCGAKTEVGVKESDRDQ